jgi:clan AA aspartic protease (TIGR02281 family)
MKLKSKMLRIILFIVVCLISILVSGIISQEGGPIWLGAVFIFVGYKLIFKNKKTYEKTIAKQAEQKEPKKTNNNKIENGKTFQKKHLLFIGLSIGVIIFLLAFGKYNNQTKSTSLKSLDNNFIRLDTKTFLEEAISEKNYTISKLEKEILPSSYDHSLLLNKAVRFNAFFDGQDYSVELYSKNCMSLKSQLGIQSLRIKYKYSKGIENAKYLFDVALKKEPSFLNQYNKLLTSQKASISKLLSYSTAECNQMLSILQSRKRGMFYDDKLGNNILSFNYITNPVDELFENHYQEFSSHSNAPNEDFFLTAKLPKSWNIKEKKDYTNASTVAVIEPYEKFLNGIITFSFYKKFVPEGVDESEYTDNDISEVFYEDDELLKPIIFSLNKELKENDKIKTTLFQVGGKNHILYMTESEIPNGLVPNQKIKSLNSISFHNGKLIKMSYSGLVSKNEFSSFPYYSKVFLKVLNSVKYRKLSENTIYLTNEQNMKFLTASINGSDYKFLLDTGASSVVINKMVLSQLIENGYLTRNNYVGKSIAEIADGSIVECEDWKIPEIKIGNNIIKDITVSVINSEDSMLLFGMDGLNKLNVKKLNLKENEITLNRE